MEFNGKTIFFLSIDGTYWIALKPICEALGVNWNRQFQNLKNDPILGQLFAEQQMVAADGKFRKMICLPEFYVYGWLFQIQSEAPGLLEYKWECYRVLHDYFTGTITRRQSVLKERTLIDIQIEELERELHATDIARKLLELKKQKKAASTRLARMDHEIIEQQLELWRQ